MTEPSAAQVASRWRRGLRYGYLLVLVLHALPAAGSEEFPYVVQPGDTLIGIARDYLQEPARWPELQRLNAVRNERRLRPGSTLRIPLDWLRQVRAPAIVVEVAGDVRLDGRPLRADDRVYEGAAIETAAAGSATLRLPDGSVFSVQPGSSLRLERLRIYGANGAVDSALRIERGRIETSVTAQRKPGARFQTRTRSAVAAVRGTRYRAAEIEAASLAEVVEGAIVVSGTARPSDSVQVAAGEGLRVEADGRTRIPVPLLPAPDTAALPGLQERVLVRFSVSPVPGARRYRGQIGTDESFRTVLQDATFAAPELRFAGLLDGGYVLRVRAIDAAGLEGFDAVHPFVLKARPEPPFPAEPRAGGKTRSERIAFAWSGAAEAASYVLQVAADGKFEQPAVDVAEITELGMTPDHRFSTGRYAWRIASVRADGDRGPWSDVQPFAVLPPPAVPQPPALDDDTLAFRWPAEPGQRFLFQLAADPQFGQMLHQTRTDTPGIVLPRPAPGTYYMRVQATDPDGFVGPFTATQHVEVPQPSPSPWLLLLPLLLLLL